MSRINRILLGLLAIQAVLVAIAFWPRSQGAGAGAPMFPDFKADAVTGLVITDENGQSVELAREGGAWVIPSKSHYPADSARVDELLKKISGLDRKTEVSKTPSALRQLKVADDRFIRRVKMTRGDGKTDVLFLGTSPSGGQQHVRAGGEEGAYLVRTLSTWEAASDAAMWLKRNYVELPAERLIAVRLQNDKGQVDFTKGEDGKWSMAGVSAGETYDDAAWTALLPKLSPIRMQEVLGTKEDPAFGLSRPVLSLKATLKSPAGGSGDEVVTFVAGAEDAKAGSHPAKSSASPFYVTVPSYALKDLTSVERARFIQKPVKAVSGR